MNKLRLRQATLYYLPHEIARPRYARESAGIGVVHIGPGAFHRAHQAVYFDELLNHGGDWAISTVSLHSRELRDALLPQDSLYTLALLDREPSYRVIGSIREVLWAAEEQAAVLARLADPATRIVSLTVTEKGYCLAGMDLDTRHPDIVADLAAPHAPRSAIGYLVEGLRRRRAAGQGAYTMLSCDNLVDNGLRLGRAVQQYAQAVDPELARWIEAECAFPSTMIDSITPATDDPLRARVLAATGLADAWPIQREAFSQWVIEDRFTLGRPDFAMAGVTLTDDVGAFDRAKLRLLNGAHSSLAYLGSLLGLETVAEAMREPLLCAYVEQLMRDSILPTVKPPKGLNLRAYIDTVLERFRNPAIAHKLSQIAWDGSQKLPFRLLGTVSDRLEAAAPIDALCLALAGWMHFVRRLSRDGVALVDPLAQRLAEIGKACSGEAQMDVPRFLQLDTVFAPALAANPSFHAALEDAYARLGDGSSAPVRAALSRQ
ncbi:mannitol dehydrogenase family protein [Hydrocarboniphaga sp.]|uniref:mannitol dehydrogenase family protein n=1 Tax=Hydrocarboniphaga sp. TaxID=2033016 RepID=UPI003D106612